MLKINYRIFFKALLLWAVCALAGLFLIYLFPVVYGWLSGGIIGGLFDGFLSRHDRIYSAVQSGLSGLFTLLAVGGFDFIFLFMTYMLFNVCFARKGTVGDIAGLSLRAAVRLLCTQFIFGIACVVFFGNRTGFSVFLLIPPFFTQGLWSVAFMLLWEISVFIFAFGYAFTDDGIKAWLAGLMLGVGHFLVLAAGVPVLAVATWLPAFILEAVKAPLAVWIFVGVFTHALVLSGLVWQMMRQPDIAELLTPQ